MVVIVVLIIVIMEIESANNGKVETSKCSTGGYVTFILGLVSGTFSALLCKMAYETESIGLDGEPKLFVKPIMMLLLMFSAMVPAIFFWLIQQACTSPEKRETVSVNTMIILIVPCLCDLICTLLLLTAQVYISASMWQMLRGTVICITAVLKRFLLNHRLRKHMWAGVGIITIAMLLVASTSLFQQQPTNALSNGRDPRIGVVLVLMGCVAQGVQYVFEEKVMAVDNAPPLVVIGCEGLWGTVLSILVVYPVAYLMPGDDNGSFENPWDAIRMAQNSKQLQSFMFGFVAFVTIYNCMAVYVTKYLSAIWHAILDNFRPVTIWAVDLLIYYVLMPGSGFGEAWVPASWLQLGGLLVLFYGTAMYDGAIMTWDDDYNEEEVPISVATGQLSVDITETIKSATPAHLASPAMSRSPLVYKAAGGNGSFNVGDRNRITYSSTGTGSYQPIPGRPPRSSSESL